MERRSEEDSLNVRAESVWGSTLHHLDDLPYNPKEYLPHIYGKFREKQAGVKVRPLVDAPKKGELVLPKVTCKVISEATVFLPSLENFGFSKSEASKADDRACYDFKGGEDSALKRLQEYIHSNKSVALYDKTRNQLIGSEYSSKLSPWLANGSISCREIYHETRKFEKENSAGEGTKIFIDELFWRDFNRYWCMKYADKVFSEYGIYDR
jgi:deoxyribodipyrimidine photo-lyase